MMAIFPLVVELNLVKCRQRFSCLPWGNRPTLAQRGRMLLFQNKRLIDEDDDYIEHQWPVVLSL